MKKKLILFIIFLSTSFSWTKASDAYWITANAHDVNSVNTWIAYRKDVNMNKTLEEAIAKIAVDSKYWLWINGDMVVFEGGIKRGPTPLDTYYDEINLAPYLKKGKNSIAILVWYFGKDGFSHKDSGKGGLIFDLQAEDFSLTSDASWISRIHPGYGNTLDPNPNFRLPESNIQYDGRNDMQDWQTTDCKVQYDFTPSLEIGKWGDAPWNELVKRPIPQWKDYGIIELTDCDIHQGVKEDTLIYSFPYNLQMTPILNIEDAKGGQLIHIYTDNTFNAGNINLRAEYITRRGEQEYESLGWLNGHKLLIILPHGVKLNKVSYRETGYDAHPIGKFSCDNDFYTRFWDKALRTLYINMRDTFFDCPDRERAQWWGDLVLLMGECFYTFSQETHDLMKKGIHELIAWQKPSGVLYSPIPAGNYTTELPGQMLASIGEYGFWSYYMHTGDLQTIKSVYPGVKKYLNVWELDETGLTRFRSGDWTWGDWGDNKDLRLIFAGWHYIALKAASKMAKLQGYEADVKNYENQLTSIKRAYNECWDGIAYRHPDYKEATDDRVQALAVLAGIAEESKYPQIYKVLQTEFHASPYMEKYIMEALFKMGYGDYAMERTQERFSTMVNNPNYTTLFEGWDIGEKGFGGGTVNHAWSGGAQIVIAEYICGIRPIEPGYKTFRVEPNPILFKECSIEVPSVAGTIKSSYTADNKEFVLSLSVPIDTEAIVSLPSEYAGKTIYINNKKANESYKANLKDEKLVKPTYSLKAGYYKIEMK